MSTVKIADLPVAATVADVAVLPVVQADITQQATRTTFLTGATLTNPNLGTPAGGTLTNCTGLPVTTGVSGLGANVAAFLATPSSANLAAALTDETGSGANVFANSPTLVTPVLGTPTSGTLTNCTGLPVTTGVSGLGSGVATFLATPSSANLAAALTDETGSGANVFANSPTLVTPTIGVATATSINKVAITAPATSATLTIANGKTLTTNNSLTFAGTDSTVMTFPSTSASVARTDDSNTFINTQNFSGPIVGGAQSLSGAGAVNVTTLTTAFTSTATGNALTLANGVAGQFKTVVYVAEAAGADTGVLTPTTPLGYSTITFTNVGDSVTLQYFTQGWAVIGVRGATVA